MSKKNRPTLTLPREQSHETPTEKIMEAIKEAEPEQSPEKTPEVLAGPTAKEMAAAEEQNGARLKAQSRLQEEQAERDNQPEVNIIGLAAKGREYLLEEMRKHQERNKPKEYIPPPRTERQMSALQEELEAGRKSQQKAEAQQASRPIEKADVSKEGFTTPVYRPNDMVPDPMLGPGKSGNGVYAPIKADDAQ